MLSDSSPPQPAEDKVEMNVSEAAGEACCQNQQREVVEAKDNGVGVLGWLGFVIINFAAWGIIGVSTAIAWPVGLAFCIIYTGILIALAVCLHRRWGDQYRSFENLLWVLACFFVFLCGLYIAVNLVGPAFDENPENAFTGGRASINNNLVDQLPKNSSAELKAWAKDSDWRHKQMPTFADYEGYVFFAGMSQSFLDESSKNSILLRSDGSTASQVSPTIEQPTSLTKHASKLYFVANTKKIHVIDSAAASAGTAALYFDLGVNTSTSAVGSHYYNVRHLVSIGGSLYFEGDYDCKNGYTKTVFKSDGTADGIQSMRGALCSPDPPRPPSPPSPSPPEDKKPVATIWSTILLGLVPMMALAAWVLWRRRLEGLFTNLFLGTGAVIILLYILAASSPDGFDTFLKWFVTTYTGATLLALSLVSLIVEDLPPVVERMKNWVVVVAGVPFFAMIHVDLEIPLTMTVWRWVVYAVLAIVQMLISIIVARIFPMIMGSVSTFVVAWKISREIVRLIFGDSLSQLAMLLLLIILAVQGIGIILGAVFYSSRRDMIDTAVREFLKKCLRRRHQTLSQLEEEKA